MKRATQWPWLSVVDMRRGLSRPFMPRPLCFVFCVLCSFKIYYLDVLSKSYCKQAARRLHITSRNRKRAVTERVGGLPP
jgi:hypothetical protein